MREKLEKFQCEITNREYKLVGQSITANFPTSFPDAAIEIQKELGGRRHEIKGVIDPEVMISPYMCNEIIATYLACLEVVEIVDVPDRMIGFHLPAVNYAKINCTNQSIGEGYARLFAWMNDKGLKQKFLDQTFPLEIFYFEDDVDEEDVELLIPIQD